MICLLSTVTNPARARHVVHNTAYRGRRSSSLPRRVHRRPHISMRCSPHVAHTPLSQESGCLRAAPSRVCSPRVAPHATHTCIRRTRRLQADGRRDRRECARAACIQREGTAGRRIRCALCRRASVSDPQIMRAGRASTHAPRNPERQPVTPAPSRYEWAGQCRNTRERASGPSGREQHLRAQTDKALGQAPGVALGGCAAALLSLPDRQVQARFLAGAFGGRQS